MLWFISFVVTGGLERAWLIRRERHAVRRRSADRRHAVTAKRVVDVLREFRLIRLCRDVQVVGDVIYGGVYLRRSFLQQLLQKR